MDTRTQPGTGGPAPTVVLRGGPLDGETHAITDYRFLLNITRNHITYRYAPTDGLDDEYPTLLIYTYVKTLG
jgi:hypothetical protein